MAKTYNKMQIDMNGDILSSVTAVAQDTLSRYLDCNLYNNGLPIDLTGHMAQLYIKKPEPDGLTVLTQGEITDAASGRVQFELTNQALAETGWIELQVVLTSGGGEVLSSETFKIHVLPSLRSDEVIESTNEFGALVVLFQEIQNSLDLMNAIVENFGEPGEIAEQYNATSFWQMLENVVSKVDVVAALKAYVNSTMDTDYFVPINKMISSLSGTKDFIPLDLMLKALFGDSVTFVSDGTFTVPDGVTKIKVTAVGAGGGGAVIELFAAGGGGGGACIVGTYDVTAGEDIAITIGVGGEGGTEDNLNGSAGSATVVGNLVTAAGGGGGISDADDPNLTMSTGTGVGGTAGGTGGGAGATVTYSSGTVSGDPKGEDGAFGSGGENAYDTGGLLVGGGGGSYGEGGDGNCRGDGENGVYGGGGGAGGLFPAGNGVATPHKGTGGDGGNGIVIIEWGASVT